MWQDVGRNNHLDIARQLKVPISIFKQEACMHVQTHIHTYKCTHTQPYTNNWSDVLAYCYLQKCTVVPQMISTDAPFMVNLTQAPTAGPHHHIPEPIPASLTYLHTTLLQFAMMPHQEQQCNTLWISIHHINCQIILD